MDERTKRIWRGLVNYANAGPSAIDINGFRRTVADCMGWIAASEPVNLLNFPTEEFLSAQATKYQSSFQSLLGWLCSDPNSDERVLLDEASEFLEKHSAHIGGMRLKRVSRPQHVEEELKRLGYPPSEVERFKEEANRYSEDEEDSPLGIYTSGKDYLDLADPICDFLLTEYQKWRDREYARKDKKRPPLFPIFVCPNCKKLVMPERVGKKKYCDDCSDKARAKRYLEKASPYENRDYQWLYRLQMNDPGTRRARLRLQKVQKRLAEIKARQQNSTRCQKLIHDMRLHVAPTK